ncbi:MAG: alpha/beta fold hydrolase [Oligoflexales bacterium]
MARSYSYLRQLRTVLIIEALLVCVGIFVASWFVNSVCGGPLAECFKAEGISISHWIMMSAFRPFILIPVSVTTLMAGKAWGPVFGGILAIAGTAVSVIPVYLLGKTVGRMIVKPWLHINLPQTSRFIRSQDWKIIVLCRLLPFMPFDPCTFLFGVLDFRWRMIVIMSLIGIAPEVFLVTFLGTKETTASELTAILLVFTAVFAVPCVVLEYVSRRHGKSFWARVKAMWREITDEIRINNDIIKRHSLDTRKVPVLLVYGFFSSRRALTVLEKQLSTRGFEVISFNLGGLLGVFFTRGITETAQFIDTKLHRQFKRCNFDKIHIVAYSKGGLVAMWWLLRLGGHRYCKKIITMGTPFEGTRLTWLALMTPLGLFWRDMWQMRPKSNLLREIHTSHIPDHLEIYCMHSSKDKVTRGQAAVFKPLHKKHNVTPVPMEQISHFEYLYHKNVADALARILGSPWTEAHNPKKKE